MQDEQLENALTSLDRYNKEADKIKDFITTTQVMHKCSVNHVNCQVSWPAFTFSTG